MYLVVHNENEVLKGRLFIGKLFDFAAFWYLYSYILVECAKLVQYHTQILKDVELIWKFINEDFLYQLLVINNILILITVVPFTPQGFAIKAKNINLSSLWFISSGVSFSCIMLCTSLFWGINISISNRQKKAWHVSKHH